MRRLSVLLALFLGACSGGATSGVSEEGTDVLVDGDTGAIQDGVVIQDAGPGEDTPPSLDVDFTWPSIDATEDAEEPKPDLEPLREVFFALESAHVIDITPV